MSDVTVRITPEGAAEVTRALKEVERELKNTGNAAAESGRKAKESANATGALADSAAKASLKIAGAGTALHLAGNTLASFAGKSNDTVAALGQLATQAGTLVSAFATGGPWGLALAAGTQALGALVTLLDRGSESAGKFTDRLTTLIGELDRIAERRSILEAFAPRVAAADRARRLVRGQQTAADIVSGIGVGGIATAEDATATQAAADELRREQREKAKALIRSQQQPRRRRRGGGAEQEVSTERFRVQSEVVAVGEEVPTEETFDPFGRGTISSMAESLGNVESFTGGIERLQTALEKLRKLNDPFERMKKGAEEAGQAIVENIGESATSAVRSHVDAWVSGEENIGKAVAGIAKDIIKSLVAESIVQAVFNTAQGIAALARYDYPGAAQFFAAAGTFAAVAGVAGGVGLATGAVGGGGAAAAGATGGGAAARPERPARGDDGGRTVVININAPNLVDTKAQAGRAIADALRQSGRRYGSEVVVP